MSGRLLMAAGAGVVCVSCAANPAAEVGPWSRNPPEAPSTFDTAPVLANEADVSLALRRAYPPELYATETGGRVEVWVHVDTVGDAVSRHVRTSSGYDALDCAATQVASAMQFEPATDSGQPIPAWVTRWVDFEPDPAQPPPPDRPRCEPFDTSPGQVNPQDVTKWLEWFYPKDLKARGVGGRVVLWLFVDETGKVTKHEVRGSSGHEALDQAAVEVARMLRLTPAKSLGIPTGVWVQQGFTFEVDTRPPLIPGPARAIG